MFKRTIKDFKKSFNIKMNEDKYWKKLNDEINKIIDENDLKDRFTINAEYAHLRSEIAYWKSKAEAYERMLVKAKLITSDKERLIKIDSIKER